MATTIPNTFSVPTVEGLSRQSLLKKLARNTGLLQYGTVVAGAANYITDPTQLQSNQWSPSEWIGGWIRISSTTDGLAPQAEIVPITNFSPELGRVDNSPYFTVAPEAGDTYELWKINPYIILDLIDEALTDELYVPVWQILSEVPDYDMEQSGTTDWTSSNATVTKQTSEPRSPWSGKQYLRVVSSAAGGYGRTALLNVQGNKTYFASVAARATSGYTAKMVVYDETNGAEIVNWTSTQLFPARISLYLLTPASCKQVSIRLVGVENGATVEFDEVVWFGTYATDLELPYWVKHRDQVKAVFQYTPLTIDQNLWDIALKGEHDARFDVFDFGQKKRVVARTGLISWPLYILGIKNETVYANDTVDLKYIDPNLFLECIKWKIYKYLNQPSVSGILDQSSARMQLADSLKAYLNLQAQQAENFNVTISSPTPMGRFLDERFRYGA